MAVAELEQNKNNSTGTSSGYFEGIKSVNSCIKSAKIDSKVYITDGSCDRYKELEDFSFAMPGGWGSRDIEIFLKSCWTNLDHLRTLSNDENKKWGEIATFITEKSNSHVFTINSCMEVAMCIKEYINEKKDILMSDNSFKQFYNEVLHLLPYFPEPRHVSQSAQINANTSWFNAVEETYTQDKNIQLRDLLIELITTNYNEIKEGNQSIWGKLSTVVCKRTGLNIDIKAIIKHVKRILQSELPQEKEPLEKKELFISFVKKIVNGHNFLRYSLFHIKSNSLSPQNVNDCTEAKLKRRYSADKIFYRKNKNTIEDNKIINKELDLVNVGRRTLQKRRGRKPRNLGARKLEAYSCRKTDNDICSSVEFPDNICFGKQVLEPNNETNLNFTEEIMLGNTGMMNKVKLGEQCLTPQSDTSEEVTTNTKKKESVINTMISPKGNDESKLSVGVTSFPNETNNSLPIMTIDNISKIGVKKLDQNIKQSKRRTLVNKTYEAIPDKAIFIRGNDCKVVIEKCETFVYEASRKRILSDNSLTNLSENELPVKQIKIAPNENVEHVNKSKLLEFNLTDSYLFDSQKEASQIKVSQKKRQRKLQPPTRILPTRKCAVKENELFSNEKIFNDLRRPGVKFENDKAEVDNCQLIGGKSQLYLSERTIDSNQLEFDNGQSTDDHSYSIQMEGKQPVEDTCSLDGEGNKSKIQNIKKKSKRNTIKSKKFVKELVDKVVNSEPEQLGSKRDECDYDQLGFMSHNETRKAKCKTRRNKKLSHVLCLPSNKDTNKKDYEFSNSTKDNINKLSLTNSGPEIISEDISPLDLSHKLSKCSSVFAPQKITSISCRISMEKLSESFRETLHSMERIRTTLKENSVYPNSNKKEQFDEYATNVKSKKIKHDRTIACRAFNEEKLTFKAYVKRKHSLSAGRPLSKEQNDMAILTDSDKKIIGEMSCDIETNDDVIVGLDKHDVQCDAINNKEKTKTLSTSARYSEPHTQVTKFGGTKQKKTFITKNKSLLAEISERNLDKFKTTSFPKQLETKSNFMCNEKHKNDKRLFYMSSITLSGEKANKETSKSNCKMLFDKALPSTSHRRNFFFSDNPPLNKDSQISDCIEPTIMSEGGNQLVKQKMRPNYYTLVELNDVTKSNNEIKLRINEFCAKVINKYDKLNTKCCVWKPKSNTLLNLLTTASVHNKQMVKFNAPCTSQIKKGCIIQNNKYVLPFINQLYKNFLSYLFRIPDLKMKMSVLNNDLGNLKNFIHTNRQFFINTIPYLCFTNKLSFPLERIDIIKYGAEWDHCYSINKNFSFQRENIKKRLSLKDKPTANKRTVVNPALYTNTDINLNNTRYLLTNLFHIFANRLDKYEKDRVGFVNNTYQGRKIIKNVDGQFQIITRRIKVRFKSGYEQVIKKYSFITRRTDINLKFALNSTSNSGLNDFVKSVLVPGSGNNLEPCKIILGHRVMNAIFKLSKILESKQRVISILTRNSIPQNKFGSNVAGKMLAFNSIGSLRNVTDIPRNTHFPCKTITDLCQNQSKGRIISNPKRIFNLNKYLYSTLGAGNDRCRYINTNILSEILKNSVGTTVKTEDRVSVEKSGDREIQSNDTTFAVLPRKQIHIQQKFRSCRSSFKDETSGKMDSGQQNNSSFTPLHEGNNTGILLNCTSHEVRGSKRKLSERKTNSEHDMTTKKQLHNVREKKIGHFLSTYLPLNKITKSSVQASTSATSNSICAESSKVEQKTALYSQRKFTIPSEASSFDETKGSIPVPPTKVHALLLSTTRQQPSRKAKTSILCKPKIKIFIKKNNSKTSCSETINPKIRCNNSDFKSNCIYSTQTLTKIHSNAVKLKLQKCNKNLLIMINDKFPLLELNDIMKIKFVSSSLMNKGSVNIVEFDQNLIKCKSSRATSNSDTSGNLQQTCETTESNTSASFIHKTFDRCHLLSEKKYQPKHLPEEPNFFEKSINELAKPTGLPENTSNKVSEDRHLKEAGFFPKQNIESDSVYKKGGQKSKRIIIRYKDSNSTKDGHKVISRTHRLLLAVKNRKGLPSSYKRITHKNGMCLNKREADSPFKWPNSNLAATQSVIAQSSVTREGTTSSMAKNSDQKSINVANSSCPAIRAHENRRHSQQVESKVKFSASSSTNRPEPVILQKKRIENQNKQINLSLKENISYVSPTFGEDSNSSTNWFDKQKQRLAKLEKLLDKLNKPF